MILMTRIIFPVSSWLETPERKILAAAVPGLLHLSTPPACIQQRPLRPRPTQRRWRTSSSPDWSCWGWWTGGRWSLRPYSACWRTCWSVPCVVTWSEARCTSVTRVMSCALTAGQSLLTCYRQSNVYCRCRLVTCPVCRAMLTLPPIRNRALERLASLLWELWRDSPSCSESFGETRQLALTTQL